MKESLGNRVAFDFTLNEIEWELNEENIEEYSEEIGNYGVIVIRAFDEDGDFISRVIADFDIDIDSPYEIPTRDIITSKPEAMDYNQTPIEARHYGRNIENMIQVIAAKEDDQMKDAMIKALASYMRQQYLIWNKDTVSEETIYNDIRILSKGKLIVPDHIHLDHISDKEVFNRPGIMGQKEGQPRNQHNRNKNGKKRWKK